MHLEAELFLIEDLYQVEVHRQSAPHCCFPAFQNERSGCGEEDYSTRCSKELKETVLHRLMSRANETLAALAEEFNITVATLYAWRRQARVAASAI